MSTLAVRKKVAAAVLAGGTSSRMGRPKALLDYHGRPLVEYLIAQLREQSGDVFVVGCPEPGLYSRLSVPVVEDLLERCGPLAGIYSALSYLSKKRQEGLSDAEYLLIVPCDGVRLPDQFAESMLNEIALRKCDLVYARDSVRDQPLYGLLRVSEMEHVHCYLTGGGRKVRNWYETRNCAVVDFAAKGFRFSNLNSPQDWQDYLVQHE